MSTATSQRHKVQEETQLRDPEGRREVATPVSPELRQRGEGNKQRRNSRTGSSAPPLNPKPTACSAMTGLRSGPGHGHKPPRTPGVLGPTKALSKHIKWSGASVFQGCLEVSNHGALGPLPFLLLSLQDNLRTMAQAAPKAPSRHPAAPLPHGPSGGCCSQPQGQDVGRNWWSGELAPCTESSP